ncbi:alpha-E domain-containing protein [Hymenobacter volaticus]|uniref:Alpha-E domain-containing protein n=1 Tax=Hymenobacter volaticus TaxID=2932254 RepID=A0ABY4GG19_9BACT|nr:alpha-E domain-containing protein [Hymenobacter volaticus]UOQ69927.1 alpha-E domain-containing protein [Hymenobacter volaticus]
MLSRVADTLYWLARYMERTHAMLQVIRIHYQASQDNPHDFSWRPLLYCFGGSLNPEEITGLERDTSRVLEHLILAKNNSASAYNNVYQARENARAVQNHTSPEVWQCLNSFYHAIREPELVQQICYSDPLSSIDGLLRHGLVFVGTVQTTMPRDESYGYLNLGRLLERALQTTDIVRTQWPSVAAQLPTPDEIPQLRYLLHSLSGQELYLKTYRGDFNPDNVLHFVLHNPHFANSLDSCLNRLSWYFERLKADSLLERHEQLGVMIGRLASHVKYSSVSASKPDNLDGLLLHLRKELTDLAVALSKTYFGRS